MKKRKAKKAPSKPMKPKPDVVAEKNDDPFQFGGLPKRDLKKNLGCG